MASPGMVPPTEGTGTCWAAECEALPSPVQMPRGIQSTALLLLGLSSPFPALEAPSSRFCFKHLRLYFHQLSVKAGGQSLFFSFSIPPNLLC